MKTKYVELIPQIVIYLIFSAALYYLFNLQATGTKFQSDLPQHLSIIDYYINYNYYIPHPAFHISVYYLAKIANIAIIDSAPIIITFYVIFTLFIMHKLLNYEDILKNKLNSLLLSLSLLLVIAIYFPYFSKYMYAGQMSPNIWHNPTMLLLKPFALLSFFCFVNSLKLNDDKSIRFLTAGSIFLLTSTVIKPSFVITFIPAVALYIIIFRTNEPRFYVRTILWSSPSIIMLAYQYMQTYQSSNTVSYFHDKIIFTNLGVFKLYTPSIIISTILVLAFPLSVLIVGRRRLTQNHPLILAWLTTFVAFLQAGFLAEQQKFEQWAFGFGYVIALFILYFYSMKEFIGWFRDAVSDIGNLAKSSIITIYSLHLMSGIYYFGKLLQGGTYH